uniref:CCHC-type domain-containing protein n=1 Tax=Hordeum vulgare subsp. vulgare TaxID=112509 RepID=A0A8I6XIU7_HORVV
MKSVVPHGGGGAGVAAAVAGVVTVHLPPLTTTSYTSWAIKAEAILDAHALWSAVAPADGEEVDANKSKLARAAMLAALPEDLLMQVATKTTAKEMDDADDLDEYAGKVSSMATKYAGLGSTLDDAAMVKKLLDTVPDRLYAAVAGIEQFCDVDDMPFEEAVGRLKAFEERTRRRARSGGERAGEQLMLTEAQWQARQRRHGGGGYNDDDDGAASTASGGRNKRRGRCYYCNERGHFKRECPQRKKAAATEQAMLMDADVEDARLL